MNSRQSIQMTAMIAMLAASSSFALATDQTMVTPLTMTRPAAAITDDAGRKIVVSIPDRKLAD